MFSCEKRGFEKIIQNGFTNSEKTFADAPLLKFQAAWTLLKCPPSSTCDTFQVRMLTYISELVLDLCWVVDLLRAFHMKGKTWSMENCTWKCLDVQSQDVCYWTELSEVWILLCLTSCELTVCSTLWVLFPFPYKIKALV